MSRIGKRPVPLPGGVTATAEGGVLSVKGPKGTLTVAMVDDLTYDIGEGGVSVQPANDSKQARAFWGLAGFWDTSQEARSTLNFTCQAK